MMTYTAKLASSSQNADSTWTFVITYFDGVHTFDGTYTVDVLDDAVVKDTVVKEVKRFNEVDVPPIDPLSIKPGDNIVI